MSIAAPIWLVTLLVPVLALAAYLWVEKRPGRYAVSFPNLAVLAGVARGGRQWRRHLTAAFLVASIALLCIGVARPHMALMVPSEQATVIVTLDVSGSMQAEDIKPTRLDAAKIAVRRFLDRVPDQVRVGLVSSRRRRTSRRHPPATATPSALRSISLCRSSVPRSVMQSHVRRSWRARRLPTPRRSGRSPRLRAPSGDGLAAVSPSRQSSFSRMASRRVAC